MSNVLLEVRHLSKHFRLRGGWRQRAGVVRAVDDVSFTLNAGETLGLVGESGCGKTTTGRTLLRLEKASGGEVLFEGQNVFKAYGGRLKQLRRNMQMIFQDPYSSLNPRMTIGDSVAEGLFIHNIGTRREREGRVREVLDRVGIRPDFARRYPHEFSGGQRQRIGIARALILQPKLIVCDEPVSALDVSIQSQVLNLLADLQKEFGLSYVFIAHNLSVVEHISNRVGVMYLGKIVELAERKSIFRRPMHPYTKALISAIPVPDPTAKTERIILQGDVPSPVNPPKGCRFHPRCWMARDICRTVEPAFEEKETGHWSACHFAQEVASPGFVRPAEASEPPKAGSAS